MKSKIFFEGISQGNIIWPVFNIFQWTYIFSVELLFKDEKKIMPALSAYERERNIYKFRDRMRGYLGLPRRLKTIHKQGILQAISNELQPLDSLNEKESPSSCL